MDTAPDTPTVEVTLRPVTAEDREFLIRVYDAARDEELSQVIWGVGQREAFVRMQFDAQDTEYRRHNPNGAFDVIEVDGRPAGRLYVDRRPGDIRIVDISLLPEYRGLGVGGRLIAALQGEAAASGRILSIHVEIHNRAAELYTRMGFTVAADLGVYRRMEWTPAMNTTSEERSGEGRLVAHDVAVPADGNQEQFELAQLLMGEPVGALRQDRRALEDQRELQPLLAPRPRAARLRALGRLGEYQVRTGRLDADQLERLAHPPGELIVGEPLDRHPPMLSPTQSDPGRAR